MPGQRRAERLAQYLVTVVEATGYWQVVGSTIKRDEDDAAAVEVEFGLDERVTKAAGLRQPLRPGRCPVYIEQTRVRVPAKEPRTVDPDIGALTLYEYDLVDAAYRFELAYHFHGHGGAPYYHSHRRDGAEPGHRPRDPEHDDLPGREGDTPPLPRRSRSRRSGPSD